MITHEKLEIWSAFGGDIDGWARLPRGDRRRLKISDDEWKLIEELLNRLQLQGSGLASGDFDRETDELVRRASANNAVEGKLRALAKLRRR